MVTPSNDPFTMLMMIIPVIILYLGSISLVAIVERNRNKRMGGA
jgi:Sec-independent protein secretion pathway component TatC